MQAQDYVFRDVIAADGPLLGRVIEVHVDQSGTPCGDPGEQVDEVAGLGAGSGGHDSPQRGIAPQCQQGRIKVSLVTWY